MPLLTTTANAAMLRPQLLPRGRRSSKAASPQVLMHSCARRAVHLGTRAAHDHGNSVPRGAAATSTKGSGIMLGAFAFRKEKDAPIRERELFVAFVVSPTSVALL